MINPTHLLYLKTAKIDIELNEKDENTRGSGQSHFARHQNLDFCFVYICSDEDFVNSETKLRAVPKTTVIFSHERSWNLNKKLSHQHRKIEGEVGNRAKTNFRDTRVIGQLHRERFRYSLVFADVIRRRQSSRFAH